MGKGGGGASQRPVTEEEKRLWDSQAENLDALTKIAQDQYDLSVEERQYFEDVFRNGNDTDAKNAIAKIKEKITGKPVDPNSITGVNVDSLLRDTLIASSDEFRVAADTYIKNSNVLTEKYGKDVTGISDTFKNNLQTYTAKFGSEVESATSDYQKVLTGISDKYNTSLTSATEAYGTTTQDITDKFGETVSKAQAEFTGKLQELAGETGTIRQDVLSREKGSAYAGIGSAYAEARKQLEQTLSQRGLDTRSGVSQQALASTYQQEAMAKAQAGSQARGIALQQSEAIRAQEAQYAGQRYESQYNAAAAQLQAQQQAAQGIYGARADMAGQQAQVGSTLAQQGYQAGMAGVQGIYGAGMQAGQSAYQASMGATQGIYGANLQNMAQSYQQMQASRLQGTANLQQAAAAGQGVYGGAMNYLAGASQSYGQGAQVAGQGAAAMGQMNTQYTMNQQQMNAEADGALFGAVTGIASAAMGGWAFGGFKTGG